MKFRNLRAEMARQGKTQGELAKQLEVREGTVSRWMMGKTEPRISEAKKIAAWLDQPMDYLFAD